jgi:hypothetical protein
MSVVITPTPKTGLDICAVTAINVSSPHEKDDEDDDEDQNNHSSTYVHFGYSFR